MKNGFEVLRNNVKNGGLPCDMTTTRNMQLQRSSREKYLAGRWDGAAKTELVGSTLLGWPYPSRAWRGISGHFIHPYVEVW